MNFEDERYVRVYTRRTTTQKVIGWEGRTVLWHLMVEVDRAGVLDLGGESPEDSIAMLSDLPREVVEAGLKRLLAKGVVVWDGDRLVLPKFLEAQEARQSDAQRQRESRATRAALARNSGPLPDVTVCDAESRSVTETPDSVTRCHTESHDVTIGHSVPSCAQPSSAVPSSLASLGADSLPLAPKAKRKPAERRWRKVPDDWVPNPEHERLASELRVSLGAEVQKFRDHEFKDPKTDADAAFRNWLRRAPPMSQVVQLGQHVKTQQAGMQRAGDMLPRQLERIRQLELEEARELAAKAGAQ